MKKDIKLFKVLGIQILIDYTWFIVFFLVVWMLASGYYPTQTPGLEKNIYLMMGIFSSILLFGCVLIHELSHSIVANRNGLAIKEITLFIFGGIAKLSEEPNNPKVELKVAVAGPLSSACLALLFWLLKEALNSMAILPIFSAIFSYLVLVNIVLVLFNIIPAFPLDGGRMLRAVWWMKTGDVEGATKVTGTFGKAFSMFLIFFGIIQLFNGNIIGGLWAVFIGMFLQQAADSSYRHVVYKNALADIYVGDIMTKEVLTVDPAYTVQHVVDDYFFRHHFTSFPVMSASKLVGLLTLNDVKAIPREDWDKTTIKDIMDPISTEAVLGVKDTVMEALSKMIHLGVGRLAVIEGGKLVGIISRRDIMKLMEFKKDLGI